MLYTDMTRAIYEDIVRRERNPGLLEFVGQQLYRARVYLIPPSAGSLLRLFMRHSRLRLCPLE